MLRLFVGLELPDEIKRRLTATRYDLKGARWQSMEQLHLTLCFIGNLDDERLPLVYDALYDLEVPPFHLTVQGLGMFGSLQHPRNLWAGVLEKAPLAILSKGVRHRFSALNIEQPEQSFLPHITLARFRGRRTRQYAARQDKREPPSGLTRFLKAHENLSLTPFEVRHVSLFSSTQRPEGSHYQVIGRFPAD